MIIDTMPDLTGRAPQTIALYNLLSWSDLPTPAQDSARGVTIAAANAIANLKDGPELSTALRRLVEARDAMVRQAALDGGGYTVAPDGTLPIAAIYQAWSVGNNDPSSFGPQPGDPGFGDPTDGGSGAGFGDPSTDPPADDSTTPPADPATTTNITTNPDGTVTSAPATPGELADTATPVTTPAADTSTTAPPADDTPPATT